MKKFLCVLAAAMCGATLMLSACGGNGGEDSSVSNDGNTDYTDVTDDGEENTNVSNDEEIAGDSKEDVELTEVSLAEAYELLSVFNEKFQSAIESDSFNIILESGIIISGQYHTDEESEDASSEEYSQTLYSNVMCLYDGEHFYGDIVIKGVENIYPYEMSIYNIFRDTQSWYSWGEVERFYSYDSIAQSIGAYYTEINEGTYVYGVSQCLYILSQIQEVEEIAADYEDVEFQSEVKIYSQTDYLSISLSYTSREGYYTEAMEFNMEVNLAAGLAADDFEPLS